MNRGANALVGAAAAQIAGHRRVDVGIRRLRGVRQQRRRRHDLAGLAAALRNVQLDPGLLNRMLLSADPSMVMTFLAPTALTGMTQERILCPSKCTVHAPHSAMPQPNFVPVMPNTSRNTQRSGVSPSTSTLYVLPLTRSVNVMVASLFTRSSNSDRRRTGRSPWARPGRWLPTLFAIGRD